MIIKSMSRKVPSFDQLISYMDLGASSREHNIYYNLYSRKPEGIKKEFMTNSHFLPKRKNGVFMYHEVISITRSQQIDEQQQIEILRQMVYQYIQDRAGENLVYGVLHDEKTDNLHYHLLISSNGVESTKRHRLTKAKFDVVKCNLERFALECHPELQQKQLISNSREEKQQSESLSNKGVELKRRTGKTPQRDIVKNTLLHIFQMASSHEELIELLDSEHLKLYKRGKHWGVLNERTNRKHRFTTLGVAEAFQQLESRFAEGFEQTQKTAKEEQVKKPTPEVIRVPKNRKTQQVSSKADTDKQNTETQQVQDKPAKQQQGAKKLDAEDVQASTDPLQQEVDERLAEIKKQREKKAQQKSDFKKKQ